MVPFAGTMLAYLAVRITWRIDRCNTAAAKLDAQFCFAFAVEITLLFFGGWSLGRYV